jgi:glycosyltransferase involved in cell wall biosynthesis
MNSSSNPRVSVCLCTYNGAKVVDRAVRSVLNQSYDDFELLVVDDASTDATVDVVRTYADPRIRIIRNTQTLGNARNRSRAVQLASGQLIKFLDQDDWLAPECLQRHTSLFARRPDLGFTFSRRALHLEDPSQSEARIWSERYGELHLGFGKLAEVNSGRGLFARLLEARFHDNWVGEPSCVMVRRACLLRSGLFNRFLRQMLDLVSMDAGRTGGSDGELVGTPPRRLAG